MSRDGDNYVKSEDILAIPSLLLLGIMSLNYN